MRPNVVFSPRAVSRNVRQVPRAAPGAGVRLTSITSSPGLHALDAQRRAAVVAAARPSSGVGHQCVATTRIAVTSALSVASGSSTFQPKLISWS